MEPMEKILSAGMDAGLSQEDLARATRRILEALPATFSKDSESSARLLSGLSKNISDNPMLVAWGLKVAAHASDSVWRKVVDTFVIGVVTERKTAVSSTKKVLGYHPPVTLVLNPTMRCNLRCKGCYAYSFNKNSDMDRPLLEKVLTEARELGIQFITITGGEPFLYPDIEGVFESFSDMIFMVYTNAQHIDADRARRLSALGNVWPAVSVEGYRDETDARRGRGVYERLTAAMERLQENGVLFGISAVPTRHNTELLASDEFIDHYIGKGALFGWMFTYIPVGRDPDPDLMATPHQRELLRQQSLHWRKTRPIFMADFWNDGPLCGGCMSASRFAFITSDGWAQPCTFVHFATHNVRDHTLKEIFVSEFFKTIRDRQPYCSNLLRPCKIIDHPHILREVVQKCGARPVYPGAERILEDPAVRSHLEDYSREYKKIADRAWASSDYFSGYGVQVPFYGRVNLYEIYDWRLKAETPPPAAQTEGGTRKSRDA
jgi:MoaA/NifB/PqqE/SkfB family radical SAM enzyme